MVARNMLEYFGYQTYNDYSPIHRSRDCLVQMRGVKQNN